MSKKPILLVIVGQTSTGKSDFAVSLAKYLQKTENITCEIISADSRQVYKGLNLLSGKITQKEMKGVTHHMLDIINPKNVFSVSDYLRKGEKIIDKVVKRGHLPIIVGGSGFYIDALVNGITLPEVPQNYALRKLLAQKTKEELFIELKKADPLRAKNIDSQNKVRLIRALEITYAIGRVPKQKTKNKYITIKIGLALPDEILQKRIQARLKKRIARGMLDEAKKLHKNGLSYKRMETLGLECKFVALYLQKKITKQELISRLSIAIWQYARRQKTWFKKDTKTKWLNMDEK